jgi:hypothetical protein
MARARGDGAVELVRRRRREMHKSPQATQQGWDETEKGPNLFYEYTRNKENGSGQAARREEK